MKGMGDHIPFLEKIKHVFQQGWWFPNMDDQWQACDTGYLPRYSYRLSPQVSTDDLTSPALDPPN